jgi:hypothetical protein
MDIKTFEDLKRAEKNISEKILAIIYNRGVLI